MTHRTGRSVADLLREQAAGWNGQAGPPHGDAGDPEPTEQEARRRPRRAGAGEPPARPQAAGPAEPAAHPALVTRVLSGVKPRPVRWLVPGLIPLGKLTMIAGDGGHGKSSVTLDLIASVATGRPAFGLEYPPPPPGRALLVSCEDDLEDTVVPRLLAAGADLDLVEHVEGVAGTDGKPLPFSLLHFRALEAKLGDAPDIRLVVIDPAGAYIGSAVDDHRDSELRALLSPLAELAARRNVAIVLVKHLNKGVNLKAVARVGGSVGYVNTVRSAILVAPDPEDEERKFLLPMKSNLAKQPKGVAYRLQGLPQEEADAILRRMDHLDVKDREQLRQQLFRVRWLGPTSVSADDALAAPRKKAQDGDLERAAEWLGALLKDRPHESLECCDKGNDALGLRKQLKWWRDAVLKEKLHGMPRKTGFGEGRWWFTLPGHTWPFPSLEALPKYTPKGAPNREADSSDSSRAEHHQTVGFPSCSHEEAEESVPLPDWVDSSWAQADSSGAADPWPPHEESHEGAEEAD